MDEREPSDHPAPEFLAAYLDRHLAPAERIRIAEHLARCVECRSGLTDVAAVMGTDRRRRRWVAGGSAIAAIAAALMVVVWTGREPAPQAAGVAAQRSGLGEQPLRAWSAQLPREASDGRLVWAMAAQGAQYRVSITDRAGAELWFSSTSDTAVVIPNASWRDSVSPAFWVVDALLPDGSTRTSGLTPISIPMP